MLQLTSEERDIADAAQTIQAADHSISSDSPVGRSSLQPSVDKCLSITSVAMMEQEAAVNCQLAYCRLQSTKFDYFIRFLPFGLIFQEPSKLHVCKTRKISLTQRTTSWSHIFDYDLLDVYIDFNSSRGIYEMNVISHWNDITINDHPCHQHDRISLFSM
jgi:hypothetical protein